MLTPTSPLDDLEPADWLTTLFANYITSFAPHHRDFWAWVWAIEAGVRPAPFIGIWPRGGGKSSSVELAVVALGARRRRKYVIYTRSTQELADRSVENIASLLETPALAQSYPELGTPQKGKFGNVRGWRRERLRTASGLTVDAFGLDSAYRGAKVDAQRPDMICHEIGTTIYDNGWMRVEDHPGLLGIQSSEGLTVRVWGLPFTETVTPEHRYWARQGQTYSTGCGKTSLSDPAWTEARLLHAGSPRRPYTPGWYIGWPFPTSNTELQPVRVYVPGRSNPPRNAKGQLCAGGGTMQEVVPQEFTDPEWWWFFGLWWGDGHVAGANQVGVTVSDEQVAIKQRLAELFATYQIPVTAVQKSGCSQIVFCRAWMNRWLRTWRQMDSDNRYHAGNKCPPTWVETIETRYQIALVKGYMAADGWINPYRPEAKITSVSLAGLLALRRILARLGIPASIRAGVKPRLERFACAGGHESWTQQKYDLRIGEGGDVLGLPITRTRYQRGRMFIADGCLWSKVRSVAASGWRQFAPINTSTHTYTTAFGLSHNCFDDIDEKFDSPAATAKKIETLTTSLLPAGAPDLAVLGIQNLMIPHGIFSQLADGRAEFLQDRVLSGPYPALRNLTYAQQDGRYVITGGEPTWAGQSRAVCQQQLQTWGLTAFLREAQHEVAAAAGGMYDHLTFRQCAWAELPPLARTVVWVDPAVTSKDGSDSMGIQADGLAADGTLYRLWSWEAVTSPEDALQRAIKKAVELGAEAVGVETDQGGDTWQSVYREAARALGVTRPPAFRSAKAGEGHGPKVERSGRMLADYERGRIVHVQGTHDTLERALNRFPKSKPFDLADAAYWSWYDLVGRTQSNFLDAIRHGRRRAGAEAEERGGAA